MSVLLDIKTAAQLWAAAMVRKAAFMAVIAVLLLCGTGFATAAGWSVLADKLGSAGASAVMAGSFLSIAALTLLYDYARSRTKGAQTRTPSSRPASDINPVLTEAFVTSITVGRKLGSARK